MNEKLAYLLLLGVFLIVGYLVGCVIPKFKCAGRWLALVIGFAGAIGFFVGQVEADGDHRFRILSAGGVGLQLAGIVSSLKIKKTLKRRSVDLWPPLKRQ